MSGDFPILYHFTPIFIASFQADGNNGAALDVVVYGYRAMFLFEVVPDDGQTRSNAANVLFHRLDGGGVAGHLHFVLVVNARTLIGEADGVPLVVD